MWSFRWLIKAVGIFSLCGTGGCSKLFVMHINNLADTSITVVSGNMSRAETVIRSGEVKPAYVFLGCQELLVGNGLRMVDLSAVPKPFWRSNHSGSKIEFEAIYTGQQLVIVGSNGKQYALEFKESCK